MIEDVAGCDAPLASREGFIRQVIGWREFVRHVHRATDGFRELPGGSPERADEPGDAGWSRWKERSWPSSSPENARLEVDGGARPAELGRGRRIPPAFWGEPSGLECLDHVVEEVWDTAYSHHITRLMILGNLATLLDISPRDLTDWFWVAYSDAYDWVVEPNVLGMATYSVGGLMTTKPYVSGAPYIDRMSDYCSGCRFDPKKSCPITNLYWAFLARHESALAGNQRMSLVLGSLRKRSAQKRSLDAALFERVSDRLQAGETVTPRDVEDAARDPSAAESS